MNPTQELDYLTLNASRTLFSTPQARRAVNLVISRSKLASLRGPGAEATTDQYLPPRMPGFKASSIYPLAGPSDAQVSQARGLLAQAGMRGKAAVLYTCDAGVCAAQAASIRSSLARIGLGTEVVALPSDELYDRIGTPGEPFDIATVGWSMDYLDPFDFLNVLLDGGSIGTPGSSNYSYFDDPDSNGKLRAAAQLTGAERLAAYGSLDVDLASHAAPLAAWGNRNARDLFASRIGCRTYQPVYGMDLAGLCLK